MDRSALPKLRDALNQHFSLSELRQLCFDAGIDPETVPCAERGKDVFDFHDGKIAAKFSHFKR